MGTLFFCGLTNALGAAKYRLVWPDSFREVSVPDDLAPLSSSESVMLSLQALEVVRGIYVDGSAAQAPDVVDSSGRRLKGEWSPRLYSIRFFGDSRVYRFYLNASGDPIFGITAIHSAIEVLGVKGSPLPFKLQSVDLIAERSDRVQVSADSLLPFHWRFAWRGASRGPLTVWAWNGYESKFALRVQLASETRNADVRLWPASNIGGTGGGACFASLANARTGR